jgi:predicted transcriptional regulator
MKESTVRKLRELHLDYGISARWIAAQTSVSPAFVTRYLKGDTASFSEERIAEFERAVEEPMNGLQADLDSRVDQIVEMMEPCSVMGAKRLLRRAIKRLESQR